MPLAAGFGALAWLFNATILCFIVPKFEEIFADFAVELPGATVMYLDAGRWLNPAHGVANLFLYLTILAIAVALIIATAFSKVAALRVIGVILAILLLLAGAISFLAMIPSLFIPLSDMITQMNGGA